MEAAISILASLVQLAVFIGLIVFVVKLVTKRGSSSAEGSGISIRRFFQYSIMLVTLAVAAFGVIGILDAIASAEPTVTRDTAAIARSIAFVVVGLPVFGGLAFYTRRLLKSTPSESHSLGWIGYLTFALIGSLIFVMSFSIAFIGELLADGDFETMSFISMFVWGGVWFAHWWIARRTADESQMQLHLLAGSAAGLITLAIGAGVAIAAALGEIYDAVLSVTAVGSDAEVIANGVVLFVIGALVWFFYWIVNARSTARSMLWLTYVLLIGVLGGVITAVVGAGTFMFGVLDWLIGDVGSTAASVHFAFIPGAVAALLVGVGSWGYHRVVLGSRTQENRTEVDRVYDYLLSGAGLLVAAGGLATLITIGLDALGSQPIADSGGSLSAVAITLLVVGVPLWWRHWSVIRRFRAVRPDEEVSSITRRVYLFMLFGATGLVAVISLIILVFIAVEDLLEGDLGSATINSIAVPVSLIITAGAVAWYHFAVFREDRAITPREELPTLQEVVVVGDSETVDAIISGTSVRVQALRVAGEETEADTLDDLLSVLDGETHGRVMVVAEDGRYKVLPLDD
ncbi:MAG: DUF5671 domain-containing protein [Actinomycetota bacterium]|nr:DUF5671 domain-containing protein [Actinomycetota bacterium]